MKGKDLAALDAADGTVDGKIQLSNVAKMYSPTPTLNVTVDDTGSGTSVKTGIHTGTDTITNVQNFVAGEVAGETDTITLTTTVTDRSTVSGISDDAVGVFTPTDTSLAPIAFGGAGQPKFSDVLARNVEGQYQITAGDEAGKIGNISFSNFETINFKTTGGDGIVQGTAGDDLIDLAYIGDPHGDRVDANDNYAGTNDDIIRAGAGNDTIVSSEGNDTIDGGTGRNTYQADVVGGYKLIGPIAGWAGWSVSSAGDIDGDGRPDLIIGAPYNDRGVAYLVTAKDLAAADSADGKVDGLINLANVAAQSTSYKFVGEGTDRTIGYSVSSAGDVDGDGKPDLIIGAPRADGPFNTVSTDTEANRGVSYLMTAKDLAAADAADGKVDGVISMANVAAQSTSYKFISEGPHRFTGWSVSSAGDVDGDGKADLIIGARGNWHGPDPESRGASYLMTAKDLAAADAADGTVDGVINLANVAAQSTSYKFVGVNHQDLAGYSVSSAGDMDGDGKADLLIGAVRANGSSQGSAYLITAKDLAAADAADGTVDGVINLANVAAQPTSYEFFGSTSELAGFSVSSAGDVDGDGKLDLLIGTENRGAYLITAKDLAAADAADGTADGKINLANVAAQSTSYKFVGEGIAATGRNVTSAGDVDGDGKADLLISGGGIHSRYTYLIAAKDLVAADAADGTVDGVIDTANIAAQSNSYKFMIGGAGGASISSAGDVDGDGKADIIITAPRDEGKKGVTYLLRGKDLAALDAADGTVDGVIHSGNITGNVYSPTLNVTVDDTGSGTSVKTGIHTGTDTITNVQNFVAGEQAGQTDTITLSTTVTDRSTVTGIDDNAVGVFTPTDTSLAPIAFGGAGQPKFSDVLARNVEGQYQITAGDEAGKVGNISFSNFETINFKTTGGDGIVQGTAGDDLIDLAYTGDPHGDRVDANDNYAGTNDDIIQAGAGNDTIVASQGNDTIDGGTGANTYKAAQLSGYQFHGASEYDYAGSRVASIGDLDGDGKPDLLIAAGLTDPNGTNSGSVYRNRPIWTTCRSG